ncbi:MAG: leucine-rich repeat domain-containing protein, partial [Planctomycetota bacterium]|nr:leucine-rich repeat domain-containing protein [Planctomycetota bacterium]
MRVVLGVALVGLVVCVGCGPSSPQEKAIAAIKKLGGYLKTDENKDVTHVGFSGTQVTDADLADLGVLKKLVGLDLNWTKVTDAGLKHLKGLTNLTSLYLFFNTKVTDAGLEHLRGLTNLTALWLNDTKVTDAGL